MRRDLPTGSVTFLFTDIEGSTKLLHELGSQGYSEALAEHRRILRDVFARHGGVEVDTQGDAFFYAFPSAAGAVAAARLGQEALRSGPIRVRMGVHTGTPHVTEDGYVGPDVHQGARIAAAGHGGQVLLSRETRDRTEAEVLDLGEHRLKDFDTPVWIFQLGAERFPPLKTISNTNLPHPASSFVGREREVADVRNLLTDGARLVTLTGPGGSGKTRLAIQAAADLVPEFRAGVFWVGLASLTDPTLVADTIGKTLGAKDGLADHVGERALLLLLDNFEQVVDAAPELSSLLTACPNLKVLVTSRELLRVQGEIEYPVPPLAQPEAVELFESRSGLEADEAVTELCRRLDNLPLAVELAAARASVLAPAQILDRLAKRLDLLRGGRDADPRQQTLRAAIEWSHDLLSPAERSLFARLAVFAGGCTLEAAEEVVDADLDSLQALVDKSLLRHSQGRFWMLETIREFAAEGLEQSGDAGPVRRRHAEFFTAMAERSDDLVDEDAGPRVEVLDGERPNLRSALEWSCGEGDPAVALRLSGALWRLWWDRGPVQEGRAWYAAALEAGKGQPEDLRARALYGAANMAMAGHEPAEAVPILERCLAVFRRSGDDLRVMRTLNDLGISWQMLGDPVTARRYQMDSLALAEAAGNHRMAATARVNLANAALSEGRLDEASGLLMELIAEDTRAVDPVIVATALETLALIDLQLGDLDAAADHVRRSVEMGAASHDWRNTIHVLALAGAVLARRGDPVASAVALAGSASIGAEIGSVLETGERSVFERTLDDVRAALGEERFAAAWAEGEALGRDPVLDRVLNDLAARR